MAAEPRRACPLPRDAWARTLLFCDGPTAVRVRGVASVLRDAVDLACHMGLARTGRIPVSPAFLDSTDGPLSRACRAALAAVGDDDTCLVRRLPAWFVLVGETCAEAVGWFAAHGHVAALGQLADPPFGADRRDATADGSFALRAAAANGHVAVLDRLALPPFSLGQDDARTNGCEALRRCARNGHVAVLDRLALPPFSLGQADARGAVLGLGLRRELQRCADRSIAAALDRFARPPYSLGTADVRDPPPAPGALTVLQAMANAGCRPAPPPGSSSETTTAPRAIDDGRGRAGLFRDDDDR